MLRRAATLDALRAQAGARRDGQRDPGGARARRRALPARGRALRSTARRPALSRREHHLGALRARRADRRRVRRGAARGAPGARGDRDRGRSRRARDRLPRRAGDVDDAAADAPLARTREPAPGRGRRGRRPRDAAASSTPCSTSRRCREHPDTRRAADRTSRSRASRACSRSRCAATDETGLGYVGADVVVDAHRGPVILELNARPGLAIQVANRAGLLPRLRAVDARVRAGAPLAGADRARPSRSRARARGAA